MAGAIVVLGGLNLDLIVETERLPRPGETFEGRRFYTSGGGKGANQAVAAARLAGPEIPVRMIGRVGDDAEGRELRGLLERDGIDCRGVATDPNARSGVAMIVLDAAGENTVLAVYGANARCAAAELEALDGALVGAAVLLVQQETPLETTAHAMRMARERGVLVVLDPAPTRETLPDEFHTCCDILTPNQGEAEALSGHSIPDTAAAENAALALRQSGIAQVIITLGSSGAVVTAGDDVTRLAAHPAAVVASVGAGDAFNGALAVGLAEGRSLLDAARFANAAAALAVTKPGVQESRARSSIIRIRVSRTEQLCARHERLDPPTPPRIVTEIGMKRPKRPQGGAHEEERA
jgi:ribokinase